MTTNRLAKSESTGPYRSAHRALEWAQMARDRHLEDHVKAWVRAHENGWDDEHYDSLKAEQYRAKVRAA